MLSYLPFLRKLVDVLKYVSSVIFFLLWNTSKCSSHVRGAICRLLQLDRQCGDRKGDDNATLGTLSEDRARLSDLRERDLDGSRGDATGPLSFQYIFVWDVSPVHRVRPLVSESGTFSRTSDRTLVVRGVTGGSVIPLPHAPFPPSSWHGGGGMDASEERDVGHIVSRRTHQCASVLIALSFFYFSTG